MVKTLPANIDALLEPLLRVAGDQPADAFLSQLVTTHVEPVIQGVIRHKLHFNSGNAGEQAEADDIRQEVVLQLVVELPEVLSRSPDACHRRCARFGSGYCVSSLFTYQRYRFS